MSSICCVFLVVLGEKIFFLLKLIMVTIIISDQLMDREYFMSHQDTPAEEKVEPLCGASEGKACGT